MLVGEAGVEVLTATPALPCCRAGAPAIAEL
jgi:hypothetical protein